MDYYNNQTYYDILGVTKDASLENIRAARDRLKYGEDRVSYWKWEEIDKAYDILSDKEKRREYDKNIGVNQFGGTYFIDSNSNLGLENLSNENFDSSESKENQSDDNDYQSQIQQSSNTTPIENEPENSEENNQTVYDTKDDNEEENLGQPSENGLENSSQSDSSEDNNIDEESEIDETKEKLKNDIFENLKFKQNEISNFKNLKFVNTRKIITSSIAGAGLGVLSFVLMGSYGVGLLVACGAGSFINKNSREQLKKITLTKESYTGIITEIQTTESKLIEESNNKLMNNINKLLEGNYNDAELQKQKLNYTNQVELLDKIIEVRKNTKKEMGLVTKYELGIYALKLQLHRSKKHLKEIDKKIKREKLVNSIGEENINFNSKLLKNLKIGNIYLQMKKAKLNGGKLKAVRDFLVKKISKSENANQEAMEEQLVRYR